MREIGITDSNIGIEITFDDILKRSYNCKFKDCSHSNEKGCAILEALEFGEIDLDAYTNFQKIEKEKAHFEMSVGEKKKKDKNFGKMIRNFQNQRRKNKY